MYLLMVLIIVCRCALSPDTYLQLARELKHQADNMNVSQYRRMGHNSMYSIYIHVYMNRATDQGRVHFVSVSIQIITIPSLMVCFFVDALTTLIDAMLYIDILTFWILILFDPDIVVIHTYLIVLFQSDKLQKAMKYLESFIAFVQCGMAMERTNSDQTKIFNMYRDTLKFVS